MMIIAFIELNGKNGVLLCMHESLRSTIPHTYFETFLKLLHTMIFLHLPPQAHLNYELYFYAVQP